MVRIHVGQPLKVQTVLGISEPFRDKPPPIIFQEVGAGVMIRIWDPERRWHS